MSDLLLKKQEGAILELSLNRPKQYNSFNRPMALALIAALEEAAADQTVRVILLTAQGKGFCAGQDLNEVTNPNNGINFEAILEEHYNPIIRLIRQTEKPIIAALQGVAAGAGANIALACDFVVCSEKASFTQAFSKIGLVPDSGGSYILPRLVGWQRANAMLMLSEKFTAQEALELGMIYKVVAAEELNSATQQLAERLANMPGQALGWTKRLLNASITNTLEEQLELESDLQIKAGYSADFKEGVAAFLEKRAPKFNQDK